LAMRSRTNARVVTFGESTQADVRIDNLELGRHGEARFLASTPDGVVEVRLAIPGRHMASNAAAAIATGMVLGVPLEAMSDGLAQASLSPHRMKIVQSASGATIVDDSYNANPTSMQAALETLAGLPAARRVAVLGIMAELDDEVVAHARIASLATELGIEVVAVGTDKYGIPETTFDEAVDIVTNMDGSTAVLVKGSRVAGLDRLIERVSR
jgi:UDP-N-acetylmuramoyl-tripeptide--D-alanyl-D-alanine ligase